MLPNVLVITTRIRDDHTVMSRQTRRAVAANAAEPLNAYAVADFQVGALATSTHLDNLSYALMAADLVGLRGVR